jgi:serine/threonine protein kinase
MSSSELPKSIGKYEVIRHLAWGGMAEVLLARLSGADGFSRHVVIKRILPQHSENTSFVQMFRDEARITAQLLHGNIVQVLEFGCEEGHHHLVLEYVPGVSLAALLAALKAQSRRLSVAETAYVITEVARALDYAHRKRGADGAPLMIVHRDVSPSNVLLSNEGEVKLLDFGIARARARLTPTAHGVGTVKGKLSYLAPETLEGRAEARSDIFALGLVAYEMLTSRPPFSGSNEAEVLYRVMAAEIPPPSLVAPEVPPTFDRIVGKMLSRDLDARPSRALEIVEALSPIASAASRPAVELLTSTLASLGLARHEGSTGTQVSRVAGPERPILIVDQSRTMRAILRSRLTPPHRVVEAASGDEALVLLRDELPSVVVCQAMLPGQSGVELCQTARREPGLSNVPFLLVASDPGPDLLREASAAGIEKVLDKSAGAEELRAAVDALLPKANG